MNKISKVIIRAIHWGCGNFLPTRSGKSAPLIIPGLLTKQGLCVVNDIKYALFEVTSDYRANHLHQRVFLFSSTRQADNF